MKPLLDAAALLAGRTALTEVAMARAAAERAFVPAPAAAEAAAAGPAPPPLVGLRMAEYVLLAGIPLRYLVPDPALLPDDALRFFHLDPDWLGALLDGILSIGLGEDAETAAPDARAAVTAALPLVRDLRRGRPVVAPGGPAGPTTRPGDGVCGFLLRSTLVERWPGLIVRAYAGTVPDGQDPEASPGVTPLTPLRLERLTPSILVVLWARAPDLVVLQEPPAAPRLGVDETPTGPVIRVRNPDGAEKGPVVPVPVDATTGVVDLAALAVSLQTAGHLADAGDGAALAMQLLQPPVRRRFRRTGTP